MFYYVRVFKTVKLMLAHLRHKSYPRRPGRFCKGHCSSWVRVTVTGKRIRTHKDMGEIVFAAGWMGAGIIAHESSHAVLGWARRIGLETCTNPNVPRATANEERFCYAHGELVRQIAVQAWKRGFAK